MDILFQLHDHFLETPIFFDFFEISFIDECTDKNEFHLDEVLQLLKGRNFQIIKSDNELVVDNYSNFHTPLISQKDFSLSDHKFFEILEIEIFKWVKHYNNTSDENVKLFIRRLSDNLQKWNDHYPVCFMFNLDATTNHHKRHPYYSLYEYFKSFILLKKDSKECVCCYAEMYFQ